MQSPQVDDSLAELRSLSQQLIAENPFAGANQENAWAAVQQHLRARTEEPFAREAFSRFWSATHLAEQGWQQELAFWDDQIRPLVEANYYRRVDQAGRAVDYFWLIDLPFVTLFATDILARTLSLRYRNPNLTWLNVGLRRWYDLFLLLPFWRWLRIIPVALRLYQVDLLDLEPIRTEAQRDTIVLVGADLAGIVGIQLIEQMQTAIRQGDLLSWLSSFEDSNHDSNRLLSDSADRLSNPESDHAPSQNSDQDSPNTPPALVDQQEIAAIANHLYDVGLHQILPRIQPDLEDLVQHSLTNTLEQVPGYAQLNHLAGLGRVSSQMVQQLANSVVHGVYHTMTGVLLDPEGKEITARLQRNLRIAIVEELGQDHATQEIQNELVNILENIKQNYVKAVVEASGEELAERTEVLHRQIR
ncbi:hypothetical protein [Leptolyngbya sp. 7M]|uniref:hypothetical protein n=1 Tax=Leptolyngbya sp. 7M TaxID=2812896 RepID=UPI001B8B2141|nr:hypothetical protein [Leptolyngbya sp. 7M]QYO63523.1 hypothetical protein JVX88_27075 [Leptolyngbya sp. 7M]